MTQYHFLTLQLEFPTQGETLIQQKLMTVGVREVEILGVGECFQFYDVHPFLLSITLQFFLSLLENFYWR